MNIFSLFNKTQKNNYLKWESFSHFLRFIEVVAIVGGVIFAGYQLRDLRNNQSAQFMLEFNQALSSPINTKIIFALENNKPIFIENGGEFTTADIDNYLGNYELLNNTYQVGLISNDMLYNGFSYDIVKTYQNTEIKNYLAEIRKNENDEFLFAGFEQLAKNLENIN